MNVEWLEAESASLATITGLSDTLYQFSDDQGTSSTYGWSVSTLTLKLIFVGSVLIRTTWKDDQTLVTAFRQVTEIRGDQSRTGMACWQYWALSVVHWIVSGTRDGYDPGPATYAMSQRSNGYAMNITKPR
jgi:hypothetical protein